MISLWEYTFNESDMDELGFFPLVITKITQRRIYTKEVRCGYDTLQPYFSIEQLERKGYAKWHGRRPGGLHGDITAFTDDGKSRYPGGFPPF